MNDNLASPSGLNSAVYARPLLSLYDFVVHGISSEIAWRCPTARLIALYNQNVSNKHLEIGPGTGFFLERCTFPSTTPDITLLDVNGNSMQFAARRIGRFQPRKCVADARLPFPLTNGPFGSVGINYVLHCVPGAIPDKAGILANARNVLSDGGVLFGATLLEHDVKRNLAARALMGIYNRSGVFNNTEDRIRDLETALKGLFSRVTVELVGCAAIFTAIR